VESSASARRLEPGIARRLAAEAALKKSGEHRLRLLQESSRLQSRWRHQARAMLSAQEDERQKTSRHLDDEIVQTLLGIHIRLLTLKQAARANTGNLKKEIASTQRLVKQSVSMVNRFAHEFGAQHKA
jgi:signal transduction histidine kinase